MVMRDSSAARRDTTPTQQPRRASKPKHLARKLQALTPDDPQYQDLLRQQQALEQHKALRRTQGPPPEPTRNARPPPAPTDRPESPGVTTSPRSSHSTSQGPSPSSRLETEEKPVRQRGQRRRGRKDTSRVVQEEQERGKAETQEPAAIPEVLPMDPTTDSTESAGKRQGRERYCVGRRPVTDFVVGSKHDGRVVYVKPFGIFIDIGCHSDAFCHVSRLADDFVEDPQRIFHPGDEIKGARVVETDRLKKRITVSLQSDARIADERTSLLTRQERNKRRRLEDKKVRPVSPQPMAPAEDDKGERCEEKNESSNQRTLREEPTSGSHVTHKARDPPPSHAEPEADAPARDAKRLRKLERRAARREQQQLIQPNA